MELIQETKNDKRNEGGITLRDIVELIFDNCNDGLLQTHS